MYIPISYKHDLKNQKSQGKMFNILDFFFIIWIKIKHANTQAMNCIVMRLLYEKLQTM